MTVYLATLFVVTLSAYLAHKSRSTALARVYLLITFATMVAVAGLRARGVGTDTWTYISHFERMTSLDAVFATGAATWEYGFWFLNWLVHFVSDQYMALFFAIAVIVVGCYQRAILACSSHIGISFFVFVTMGFYTFFFNGARQGIACAICALAIGPLLDRNLKKYLAYVLLAVLFHKTALVMIPVYFLLSRDNTLKMNILYGFIGVASALSLQRIVEIGAQFDMRYKAFGMATEGGGFYVTGFICILALFFLLIKNKITINRDHYNIFLNMFIFGAIISLISALLRLDPSGIMRLSLYFNVGAIFLWPIVYKNINNKLMKIFFNYSLFSFYTLYFILTTQRFSNLVPYIFNPIF